MQPGIDTADVREHHRPADLAAAREALLECREAGTNVLVHGGGTKLGWGARIEKTSGKRAWSAIDTRSLDQLVHHEPGDMTATVEAGLPLACLQERLADAGQELAVDPPRRAGGVTVGGVYVANDAGPRRFAHGGIRDLVIGTTAVLADGTISRSGGTVIKNVAGYDLSKLWCGSLGTLALVVEMTVRLHPRPEGSRSLLIPASAADATAFLTDLLASPVECSAVEWSSDMITGPVHGTASGLFVRLEGRAAGLPARADRLVEVARRHGLAPEPADDDAVLDAWREAHAGGHVAGPVTIARAASLPAQLADVGNALSEVAAAAGVDAELHSHAGSGLHDAVLRGGDPSAQASAISAWRDRVGRLGGSVVLRDRREGVDESLDPWGEPGSAALTALTRSVKRAVDPEGRLAPGRFVGGL